jgi:putative SOS response-associated peptidase YedK
MPGVFPDYPAPVIRNVGTERELTMMRWGMPPPKFGGPPVTNIRNTSSPHWRNWLKRRTDASFSEYAPEPNPLTKKKDVVWFAVNDDRPLVPQLGNTHTCQSTAQCARPATTLATTSWAPG